MFVQLTWYGDITSFSSDCEAASYSFDNGKIDFSISVSQRYELIKNKIAKMVHEEAGNLV